MDPILAASIKRIIDERADLTVEEMQGSMKAIMEGRATDAQIAAFLIGLRLKGETIDEIVGAASVMREKAKRIRPAAREVLDTCGTGGDRKGTLNISTMTAIVAAGAGVPVAKHGNYSVSSKCGSADLLEALGVNIRLSVPDLEACLGDGGIAFLFAPMLHEAMKFAIGPRKEVGVRTIFNVLGPLTNPAGARFQLLGVYDPDLAEPIATVLSRLGTKAAWVVHGEDGTDEITLTGKTRVAELKDGAVTMRTVSPADFDLPVSPHDAIAGGEPADNAEATIRILGGEAHPARDTVVANAAAALYVLGKAKSLPEGAYLASTALDSGAASAKLDFLRTFGGPNPNLPGD